MRFLFCLLLISRSAAAQTDVTLQTKLVELPPLSFYKKLMEEMYGIKDHPDIELN